MNWKEKRNFLERLVNSMNEDKLSAYTAQCSYYTILSFIPFLILLITLIQYTNIQPESLIVVITKIFPEGTDDFIIGIVREVYSKSIGTISISIIFTIWSAGKGLLALIKGLHTIYKVKGKKENSLLYLKLMSIAQTILFIVLITIGLLALVFSESLISIIKEKFGMLENYSFISWIITQVGLLILIFFVFLCIYKFMPKHKVTFKSQIPGAIVGAIGLDLVSFVFSRYLDIFQGFSITYGSLTTLILIMMWTYACFYTLFLGAEVNKNIEK